MFYNVLKLAHVLAVILWVGGMIFAFCFLRPAVAPLAPPQKLGLMRDVLGRFLNAVAWAVVVALGSGAWMIGRSARQAAESGGSFHMPPSWMAMAVLGLLMTVIFGHIRYALYPRLARAVQAQEWPAAGAAMGSVKTWVAVNLALGLLVVAVVMLG
ncbi:CopD family protein [Bordetella petrii]|uniref:CopD family protein n=1 Tax=Bordetella petrii TaxID=94624 RepID=UPI001E583365|nr:CopD family protein [Bordetella petrii]MCD0505666.1 CopD family protein [Bordetella petrii]